MIIKSEYKSHIWIAAHRCKHINILQLSSLTSEHTPTQPTIAITLCVEPSMDEGW